MTSIEALHQGRDAANEARAHRDGEAVLRWREFIREEAVLANRVTAGEATRSEWMALWAKSPAQPSKAQYDNARRLGYIS